MYRKKLILNYHIKDGYGAKRIIKVMKQRGEKPASRGVIRRLINTYDRILRTYGKDAAISTGKRCSTLPNARAQSWMTRRASI